MGDMSGDSSGIELKLHETFPTLDRETVHAVHAHGAGDNHAAMMQLIELLGDDEEALEITFALLQGEDFDEAAAQLAHDEQVALALQQDLADSEGNSAGARHAATEARSKEASVAHRKMKLSSEVRQLLVRFGRHRSMKHGAQRLLEPTSIDSSVVEENVEVATAPPSQRQINTYAPSPPSALDEQSIATGLRTGVDGREEQYNARLMRARASRRPSATNREDLHSIMSGA